jgi:hypothetical protein
MALCQFEITQVHHHFIQLALSEKILFQIGHEVRRLRRRRDAALAMVEYASD